MDNKYLCHECVLEKDGKFLTKCATVMKMNCPLCGEEKYCYPPNDFRLPGDDSLKEWD